MCGLVGIAGDLETKDEGCMKRLLLLDSIRGIDSTGIAVINNTGTSTTTVKVPSHPFDLFDNVRFRSALNGNTSSVFLGHNRASTRGSINSANAHPFDCGNVVGAHNGTLSLPSHRWLEKELDFTSQVDSLALIAAIAEFGVEKTISNIQGSWSLVWVDKKEGTLNFLRNGERPMWLAYSEDHKKLYWASEYKMLDAAIGLGSYNTKLWRDKDDACYFSNVPDVLYSFDIDKLRKGKKHAKPRVKEVKGATKSPFVLCSTSCGPPEKDPFKRSWEEFNPKTSNFNHPGTTRLTTTSHTSDDLPVVELIGSVNNPFGGILNEVQFMQFLASTGMNGCAFCGEKINWGDTGLTVYLKDKKVLCPKHSRQADKSMVNRVFMPPSVTTSAPAVM